jgi:hypothetical protein
MIGTTAAALSPTALPSVGPHRNTCHWLQVGVPNASRIGMGTGGDGTNYASGQTSDYVAILGLTRVFA